MALGVGVLCPEGGAEGVYIAKGHGKVLGVQLAGDREAGLFTEEILAVIHLSVLGPGQVLQVQGSHLEHLAGALAIGAGDDGGLHIHKAPVLEELMHRVGRHRAHPEGSGEQVGPGTQVLDRAQELHAVALLLQGIVRSGLALHLHTAGLYLQGLLGLRGQHHGAMHHQRCTYILTCDFLIIIQHRGIQHHLQILEAGAVVQLDKAKALHIPDGPRPAAYHHFLAVQALPGGKQGGDSHSFHSNIHLCLSFLTACTIINTFF